MFAREILSKIRQPVVNRLPRHLLSWARPRAGRHAKNINISNKYFRVTISLRSFATNPANRTSLKKQYVINGFTPIKEIALTIHRYKLPFIKYHLSISKEHALPAIMTAVGIAGVLFFGVSVTSQKQLVPVAHSLTPAHVQKIAQKTTTLPRSLPSRLHIEKIGVDAPIASIGQNSDGSLQVPGPSEAGWYTGSPTPGELGPAVIDGHVDYVDNIAVFWRLRELIPGDVIKIDRADGRSATFKVDDVQQFPQTSFPTDKVYGNINYAGLRLITCGGVFNENTHHYSDNTVIFASLMQ